MNTVQATNTDAEKEAFLRYPMKQFGTKGMANASCRKCFMEGAQWRNEHPSPQTLEHLLCFMARHGFIQQSDMNAIMDCYLSQL